MLCIIRYARQSPDPIVLSAILQHITFSVKTAFILMAELVFDGLRLLLIYAKLSIQIHQKYMGKEQ